MEQDNSKEASYMYRMEAKLPKMPLNDYIVRYKQTGDEQYLRYFLHCYERTLNYRTRMYCEDYGLLSHFEDIKQIIVITMLEQLEKYDPDADASLITFTELHVTEAVHNYIRQHCRVLVSSKYDYDNLRKVMAINNENLDLSEAERVDKIAEETGLNENKIRMHLHRGALFLNSVSFDEEPEDADEDYIPLIERVADIRSDPEYIILKKMFYEAIVAAVDGLSFKDKHMILSYCGLERFKEWFNEVDPLPKELLAAHLHVGKIQVVDDNFKRAVKTLRVELEKQGWA